MEVAPVDEGELHGRAPQLERGLEAAEAAADDDDPVGVVMVGVHLDLKRSRVLEQMTTGTPPV
jgi:hypothetical protein